MSRRRRADKREIVPDAKYGDLVLAKFMNSLMYDGKKSAAEGIIYGAFEIIETKRREDLDDPAKWERLQQWCSDATAHDGKRSFHALFVRQEEWIAHRPGTFAQLVTAFG